MPFQAYSHQSGCHRWHSCPSDSGSYVCGDTGHCNYCPDNQYCENGRPKTYSPITEKNDEESNTDFSCGSKRYCGEMRSCEEAQFYLTQCGLGRLDGDSDGIPCERLCR